MRGRELSAQVILGPEPTAEELRDARVEVQNMHEARMGHGAWAYSTEILTVPLALGGLGVVDQYLRTAADGEDVVAVAMMLYVWESDIPAGWDAGPQEPVNEQGGMEPMVLIPLQLTRLSVDTDTREMLAEASEAAPANHADPVDFVPGFVVRFALPVPAESITYHDYSDPDRTVDPEAIIAARQDA